MITRNRVIKESISPDLIRAHLDIRRAKLDVMDPDLSRIFEGIPLDKIIDSQLDEVMRIQEIRCIRQSVGRRH